MYKTLFLVPLKNSHQRKRRQIKPLLYYSEWWYNLHLLYARHYNPLLIRNRSWKLTILKAKGHSIYSRVHKRWQGFFSKILEKPSIVQKKMLPHIKGLDFSQRWSKKNFKMADLKNSKWPPQKNLIFQLRQFSIFFHEIPMDRSLG